MNYLAVDTCGKNLTIVLSYNEKIYNYYDKDCGLRHSVSLMPTIEKLVKEANCDFKNLDFIACVVGAGSFTGIRIGVSTVKALAFSYSLPVLKLTSFDVLAYNEKELYKENVLALIDAGHGGYYAQTFNKGVLGEPKYILKEEVLLLTKTHKIISADDLVELPHEKADVLKGLISSVEANKNNVSKDLEILVPLYVRKSQAEEGR